ncbi:MAG: glycosyltransferase [Actinobacteria bacterium]|nr:glycosyltransferase [Actinomycetota bacterium]
MTENDGTLVSICIPTYNADLQYLDELLSSIRRQGVAAVEIVVADDGSKNVKQVEEVISRHARNFVIRWNAHIGMVENWNSAVFQASGRYMMIPGQDDVLANGALRRLIDLAETYRLDLSLGAEGYIDSKGLRRPRPGFGASRAKIFADEPCALDAQAVLRLGLLYGNVIGDPCVALMRREFLQSIGGFDPKFRHACDLELWMRMAASGATIGRTPEVVALRRIHSANATVSHVKTGVAQEDRTLIHALYCEYLTDDYQWNRSVARLYTHGFFDLVRGGGVKSLWQAGLRGPALERVRALVDDCCENVGIRSAHGRRWGGVGLGK